MSIWNRFPDMQPVKSPPSLFRINGIGTAVYGNRDPDPHSGTYVKSLCFTVLFLPLFFLSAYRVADAPGGGWYFIGKVPLSKLTKIWNLVLLLLVLGGVGLGVWSVSPEHRGQQELAEANRLLAAGQVAEAAGKFDALMNGPHSAAAREHLREILAAPPANVADAAIVFGIGARLHQRNLLLSPDLYARAKKYADDHAEGDPRGALNVLDAVQTVAPGPNAFTAATRPILERLVVRDPKDVVLALRLARACTATGDHDRAQALLMPHLDKLGQYDEAALLGHLLLEKGEFSQAVTVLEPFVEARKGGLQVGQAGPQVVQDAMFDLGVALLRLAQTRFEGGSRRGDLEKAEKTFLALRVVRDDDDSKLHLGQIYYWLGKTKQGRAEFDNLLQAKQRNTMLLLRVSGALREVGADSEARDLAEEAWRDGPSAQHKHAAAFTRALLARDLDDQITWLERADTQEPQVKANLQEARGAKAVEEGKYEVAATCFRESIAIQEAMPESMATLNNTAVALFALYGVTHNRDDFARAADKLERAVALDPNHSILVGNAAGTFDQKALFDLAGAAVDWGVLKRPPGNDVIPFLYRDEASRRGVAQKLEKHPDVIKARNYYEKLLVLAPKRPDAYGWLIYMDGLMHKTEALGRVIEALEKAGVDVGESNQKLLETYAGKHDAKNLESLHKAMSRQKEVLAAARKAGGVTLALAVSSYVTTQVSAAAHNQPVDADELVKLAEAALAAAPSTGAQTTLQTALRLRAHRSLSAASPEYAALAERTRRSVGPRLVTWVVGHAGPLRDKALANADVKRLQTFVLDERKTVPEDQSAADWALLQPSHPEEAAELAKRLLSDPLAEAKLVSLRVLAPLSAETVLHRHWSLLMAGKTDEAWDIVQQAAAKGVPLPAK